MCGHTICGGQKNSKTRCRSAWCRPSWSREFARARPKPPAAPDSSRSPVRAGTPPPTDHVLLVAAEATEARLLPLRPHGVSPSGPEVDGPLHQNLIVEFGRRAVCTKLCDGQADLCAGLAGLSGDAVPLRLACPGQWAQVAACRGSCAGPATSLMRHIHLKHDVPINVAAERVYAAVGEYLKRVVSSDAALPCAYGCRGIYRGARALYRHLLCFHSAGRGAAVCCPPELPEPAWPACTRPPGPGGPTPDSPKVGHEPHELRLAARRTFITAFAREEEMRYLAEKRASWTDSSPSASPSFAAPSFLPGFSQTCRPVTLVRTDPASLGPSWATVAPTGGDAPAVASQYAGFVGLMADTVYLVRPWITVLFPLFNKVFGGLEQARVRRRCTLAAGCHPAAGRHPAGSAACDRAPDEPAPPCAGGAGLHLPGECGLCGPYVTLLLPADFFV